KGLRLKLGAVEEGHVSDRESDAQPADYRGKMSAKENPSVIRMRAAQAVGVTYRERGDEAFARGGERATVAQRSPGGNRLQHHDARMQRHHGPSVERL